MAEKRNIAISLPLTGEDEWQAIREPIMNGWLTQGPQVAAFEQAFAARHQVQHALATTSCTTALHVILTAMGIGRGDEVIVPSFTWIATANVVLYTGAVPVLVDVDPVTYNLDPEQVRAAVTDKTKAVIAVHLFGLCADIDAIRSAVPSHVRIVEDAACAAGAAYKRIPAGGLGDAAAFSFHPRKSITTGEGGMITTKDPVLAERMQVLRNHGASLSEEQRHQGNQPHCLPDFNVMGFNYRMTDLQGAVGLVQLQKLDNIIAERRNWAAFYQEALSDISWLKLPQTVGDVQHAWQAYVTFVDPERAPMPRNRIMEHLQSAGIATRPGTHAVHRLGYYRVKFGFHADDYPIARDCDRCTLAIPLHNRMTEDDFRYVVEQLHAI